MLKQHNWTFYNTRENKENSSNVSNIDLDLEGKQEFEGGL